MTQLALLSEPVSERAARPSAAATSVRGRRGVERLALLERLKSVPCADCGGRFPPYVMEFDHVRGTKVGAVGNMKYYRLDRLLSEIEKCDVVCSNCHAIRTHERAVSGSLREEGRKS